MISIDEQQKLLINISKRLKKKIIVYAIGGTAMMFLGFKESTLDIDLVFGNEKDREAFKEAVKSLGFQEMDSVIAYGGKKNSPQMLKLGDERFDLFVLEVISSVFSKQMMERATQLHQFGDTLFVRIADPHDIILMKCATDKLKDKDDARKIIESVKINWDITFKEAENQIKLGKERAAFDLGLFLEYIKLNMNLNIPQNILNKLFKVVEKQAKDKE